ncbi:MAG: diguanylate cyclase [Myxococcota bacterium]
MKGAGVTVGLRARLLIVVSLGLALSTTAGLFALLRLERQTLAQEAAERAGALLKTLSVPAALLMTQGRFADLDNLVNELAMRRDSLDLEELVLLDPAGRVLADFQSDRFGEDVVGADPFVAYALSQDRPVVERIDGMPHRVAVPVQTGIRWGTLLGRVSEARLEAKLHQRRTGLVVHSLFIGGLGALLVIAFVHFAVVSPIRAVSWAARRFAAGDLEARAPVHGGREVATLSRTINEAAERLSRHTHELEEQVQRRTEELQQKNEELQGANAQLERLAITDGLTDLINHRHFQQLLHAEVTRKQRERRPFAVLMMDVDAFKHYNDTHGHPAGDGVLKRIARILRENVRASDVVARYGGEEFVVMLLDADLERALSVGEKLRERIAQHPFPYAAQQPLGHVSVSVGVAVWPDHGSSAEDLVDAADRALYAAKGFGRDVVVAAHENDGITATTEEPS